MSAKLGITHDQRPAYVLIGSPDLWDEDPPTAVEMFAWTGDGYANYYAEERSYAFTGQTSDRPDPPGHGSQRSR